MDSYIDLLKVLLPELLITHFDIIKHETIEDTLHLYFEEKRSVPNEFSKDIVISHGFHKEIIVEDFPLRGKDYFTSNAEDGWIKRPKK